MKNNEIIKITHPEFILKQCLSFQVEVFLRQKAETTCNLQIDGEYRDIP